MLAAVPQSTSNPIRPEAGPRHRALGCLYAERLILDGREKGRVAKPSARRTRHSRHPCVRGTTGAAWWWEPPRAVLVAGVSQLQDACASSHLRVRPALGKELRRISDPRHLDSAEGLSRCQQPPSRFPANESSRSSISVEQTHRTSGQRAAAGPIDQHPVGRLVTGQYERRWAAGRPEHSEVVLLAVRWWSLTVLLRTGPDYAIDAAGHTVFGGSREPDARGPRPTGRWSGHRSSPAQLLRRLRLT